MTELPVPIIAAINIKNLPSIKNKLPQFLYVSEFYNLVIPCLNENPKKRQDAELLFKSFHALMAYWIECEKMNYKILENYKIGEKVPVDSHRHSLILSDDKMRQYPGVGWYCSICNNKDKSFLDNTLSFHCHSCEYDLCQKCIEVHNYKYVNNMMLKHVPKGKKVYVSQHPHFLLLNSEQERNYPYDGTWICDICKVDASSYVLSFHCKECNYDVCLNCYEKNSVIKEDPSCCIIY